MNRMQRIIVISEAGRLVGTHAPSDEKRYPKKAPWPGSSPAPVRRCRKSKSTSPRNSPTRERSGHSMIWSGGRPRSSNFRRQTRTREPTRRLGVRNSFRRRQR